MNALRARLLDLRREGRSALGLFLTSGFPEPRATGPILDALVRGGADFVELGMPFSDPLAEGLPIQRASARALARGVVMRDAFETAAAFTAAHPGVPLVLMGYYNPVLQHGLDRFCADAARAGAAGLILPDLPPDEAKPLVEAAAAQGLALTFLVAPNTPDDRLRRVAEASTGFVYAVSSPGLTGQRLAAHDGIGAYLDRVRGLVAGAPTLVGFGIRTADDVARLAPHADGAIVGTALIERCEALWDDDRLSDDERLAEVEAFVRGLRP